MIDRWSLESYRSLVPSLSERRGETLGTIIDLGGMDLSADEIADRLGRPKSHVMPVLTFLKDEGIITKWGTGKTVYGKTCNLWRIVPRNRPQQMSLPSERR